MKTFFLTLFLLFVLAFGGAAAFLVLTLEPASFMVEAERLGVLDTTEKLLPQLARVTGLPDLETKADEQLGLCRFMTFPNASDSAPLARITVIPNERVPFLERFELDKRSLQCKFNGPGKSILLVPAEKTALIARRSIGQSGTLVFELGKVSLYSDALDLFVAIPGIEMHLRSKGPVMLSITGKDPALPFAVNLDRGDVDVTYRRLAVGGRSSSVVFYQAPGVKLTSNGVALVATTVVSLLPSGFEGLVEKSAPAVPLPSPSPSKRLLSELVNDPAGRPILEKLFGVAADFSDPSTLRWLATNLPGAFGFRFACQFTPPGTGAKPRGVLPGEWVEAPEGGKLHCPDHYDLTLSANSRLRLRQTEGMPLFTLETGEAKIDFKASEFVFGTTAFLARVQGKADQQQITFSALPHRLSMDCGFGDVRTTIGALSDTGASPLLVSRQCKLEAHSPGGAVRTLFGNERVYLENLALLRAYLPIVDIARLTAFSDTPNYTMGVLKSVPGSPGKMTWEMPSGYDKGECTVYAQKADSGAAAEIQTIKGKWHGELQIDQAYLPGYVALVCMWQGKLVASASAATVTQ